VRSVLCRIQRLFSKADERLQDSDARLHRLLRAGDPRGEVATIWHAKEAVWELDARGDEATTREWIECLVTDMADRDNPVEVRSFRRTLARWTEHIVAWDPSHVSNGPTEAALIERVKRAAFGFSSLRNFRVRELLHAAKPEVAPIETINPAEIRSATTLLLTNLPGQLPDAEV
jgi:hypothetical protein